MRMLLFAALLSICVPAGQSQSFIQSAEERARIEQALPQKSLAPPAKPRRLLIFTLNVGYGGHPSMAYANEAFTLMGRKTGAFDTEVSNDPAVFSRESLKKFDAVFFNNTVGNCFTNADLRQNLLEFITGGGGLLGVHGTSVAFTRWPGAVEDWPEFGYLIGARGANHKDSTEHIWMKLDDPANPITAVFGADGFDYRDEFFRPQGTYSRNRERVLLSIDTAKCDPDSGQARGDCYRPDHDYAVAWIRNYGRGRIFYCTIAHNNYVFWDAKMLQFYLGALQFALGDLKCPTTPSAKCTPAVRAQEKLGWRIALQAGKEPTFAAAIENAAALQLAYIGGSSAQQAGAESPEPFGPGLTDTQLTAMRLKLETAGLRLVSYAVHETPADEAGWRGLFEFGRKMGIETFICEPSAKVMDVVERYSVEYGISVALGGNRQQPQMLAARKALTACQNRSQNIGAWIGFGETVRDSLVTAPQLLRQRLLVAELGPFALAGEQMTRLLVESKRLGLQPLFLVQSAEGTRAGIERFNASCLNLSQ
ncbi:MAG TPA: ThuA domain-containing protein [Verrucomicrobiae bacterium]